MDWSNDKIMEFIEAYRTEPTIWDPRDKYNTHRNMVMDAWLRIQKRLSWRTTVDELKKKRNCLMSYYRIHLKKVKKPTKYTRGEKKGYNTKWFAFDTMHSFLGPVYDPIGCKKTSHTPKLSDQKVPKVNVPMVELVVMGQPLNVILGKPMSLEEPLNVIMIKPLKVVQGVPLNVTMVEPVGDPLNMEKVEAVSMDPFDDTNV